MSTKALPEFQKFLRSQKRYSYHLAELTDSANGMIPEFQEFILEKRLVPDKNIPSFLYLLGQQVSWLCTKARIIRYVHQ